MVWIRDWSRSEEPRIRLLCFPCAGGGIHVYRQWARRLPPHIGLLAVELPGHDSRVAEPPETDLEALLGGPLRQAVEVVLDRPLAVYGHSVGAVLAADLCRALGRDLDWRPALFVAAGAAAPELRDVPFGAESTDEEIAGYLEWLGSAAGQLLADEEYRHLVISAVRADLGMAANRTPAPGATLDCPVRAYIGEQDPAVDPRHAMAWQDMSNGDFALRAFPGGHFFPQTSAEFVLDALVADLDAAVHGTGAELSPA
jgi:surfactin synthase thioesterase subunit